MLMAYSQPSI